MTFQRLLRLHPLVVAEHGERFDLERALRLGALPAVVAAEDEDSHELLRSFADEHPEVPRFVVTPSSEPQRLEGVLVTSWSDFLPRFQSWL